MDERWLRNAGIVALPPETRRLRVERIDWRDASDDREPRIVWLGHASFWVRWRGVSVLIDPVFNEWIGLVRRRIPAPDLQRFGGIDAALVTHGHMDHLQSGSIVRSQARSVILPRGTERLLPSGLRKAARPIALGERLALDGLWIQAAPARHGGWRYPWQRGYFACGYLIGDGERTIYAAGDTAYGSHFEEIARLGQIDWALLPIGAYAPRWFLKSRHLNPPEAIQAWRDLGGTAEIRPYHFGTYRVSLEPLAEPLPWFARLAEEAGAGWRLSIGV